MSLSYARRSGLWTPTFVINERKNSTKAGEAWHRLSDGDPELIGRSICLYSAAGARAWESGVAAHLDHNAGWEARPFRALVACGETWTGHGKALGGVVRLSGRLSASQPLRGLPRKSLVGGTWANLREQPLAHRQLE